MNTSELVKSVSIDNLLNQRDAAVAKFTAALDLLWEAETLARAAHIGFPDIDLKLTGSRETTRRIAGSSRQPLAETVRDSCKQIDARGWGYLMAESGLRTFMDAAARYDWDSKVFAADVPELTRENITATFSNLYDSRADLFDRGVINCFRALSWDQKTNQPFKFGKRVILKRVLDQYGSGANRWLSVSNLTTNRLDDLDRVFHILDGKPEPDHRGGWYSALTQCLRNQNAAGTHVGAYFSVKWFLNGNGHLTFSRPDLVEMMNQIPARHHPNALASEVR